VPPQSRWTPYLGETLDSGIATLLSVEALQALRFLYGDQPEKLEGFQLTQASFTSPEFSKGDGAGHLNGPIDDIQLRSWGIQLVDGRMPGFAAIVGCAKSPAT
jgi:acetyl-CoA synthase